MTTPIMLPTTSVQIRQDGARVVLVIDGNGIVIAWQLADVIARGLAEKARQAEEVEKHAQIQADHALLTRAGFPIGVTNNQKIREPAERDAQWDRDLRRALPGGVKSECRIGVPTFILGQPNEEKIQ